MGFYTMDRHMPHVLLLGAGFSRNWGGWVASEAFEYLLGSPQLDDDIRGLLWGRKGGYEEALASLQSEPDPVHRQRLTKLESAILQMFADMNEAFSEMTESDFNFRNVPDLPVTSFLARFDAIFTLNQDLLIERQYLAENLGMLLQPRGWQIPRMEPTTQPAATAIKEVKEWRPMDVSKFVVDANMQPYFKLHGSSN